ncbi:hypothetical protein P167DRAFT_566136 [Morchella conica CCBAS932]|uniref:Uncharacterized protein n=1 Tax=Morchella conica CCBAS932 TaxID=1392247 RepID=A0A3N4KKI5_9PEZI|nr:hypothetical protein P167DRAFT_566136 [Morchella conica CCBAS932]
MSTAAPKKNMMCYVLINTPPAGNWRGEYSFPVKEEEKEDDAPMWMSALLLPEAKKVKKEPASPSKADRKTMSAPKADKKVAPTHKANKKEMPTPQVNKEQMSAPKVNKRALPEPEVDISAPEVDKEESYHPSFDEVEIDSAGNMKLVRVRKKRKLKAPGPTPEELAARDATKRLNFTAHTSCAEIHSWLEHMNNKYLEWHIHTRLVTYTDRRRKLNEISRITRGPLPEAFKKAEKKDWNLPSCLSSGLYSVRTTGTILMFCAPIWNPVQLQGRMVAFHNYVIIYKNRTLILADPGYKLEAKNIVDGVPGKWRECELTYGLGLAAKFMAMVRKKFKVEKCWYGKGSKLPYDDTNGNVLSQDFILQYLNEKAREQIDWEKEGFVELIP